MSITDVPNWVTISFAVLFFTVPALLFGYYFTKDIMQSDPEKGKRLKKGIIGFVLVFLTTVGVLSLNGLYSENVLPPRILLFGALPLALSYILFSRLKLVKEAFQKLSLESLITIHLFRFVGVYFFIVYAYGALPKQFAYIGGGGDILTAILVFPVLYALRKKWKYALAAVFVWNSIGLLDILSVLANAVYFTQLAMDGQGEGVIQFATFPFSWIPAFAPATIIFLHVLIFKKMGEERRKTLRK